MTQESENTNVAEKRAIRTLSVLTWGEVHDVLQTGIVMLAANHFLYQDPEHHRFERNPANTLPYRALRALQDSAIVHIAETLKTEKSAISPRVRRQDELRNHRDAVSHPTEISWRRKEMQPFSDEGRTWLDHRPALVWDMHRSINELLRDVGEEPRLETITPTKSMAMMLSSILALSFKANCPIPDEQVLLEHLSRSAPDYIRQLESRPDGRSSRDKQEIPE